MYKLKRNEKEHVLTSQSRSALQMPSFSLKRWQCWPVSSVTFKSPHVEGHSINWLKYPAFKFCFVLALKPILHLSPNFTIWQILLFYKLTNCHRECKCPEGFLRYERHLKVTNYSVGLVSATNVFRIERERQIKHLVNNKNKKMQCFRTICKHLIWVKQMSPAQRDPVFLFVLVGSNKKPTQARWRREESGEKYLKNT